MIGRIAICAALAFSVAPAVAQTAQNGTAAGSEKAAPTVTTPDQVKPIRASRGGCNKTKPMT